MVQAQDNGVLLMASMVGALTGHLLSGLLTSCFPGEIYSECFYTDIGHIDASSPRAGKREGIRQYLHLYQLDMNTLAFNFKNPPLATIFLISILR